MPCEQRSSSFCSCIQALAADASGSIRALDARKLCVGDFMSGVRIKPSISPQFLTRKQGAKAPWSARGSGLDRSIASPEIEAPIAAK
jgi:hypothetical protein